MSDENTTLNTEEGALRLTSTPGAEYGIVGYTHAGGVDRPRVAYRTNGGNSGTVVVPHMNWRGLSSLGTNPSGGASTTRVEWPGFRAAFEIHGVERMEIRCDPANARSAWVPRRLGYTHEATLRPNVRGVDGGRRDTMVWSLLRGEYPSSPSAAAQLQAFDAAGRALP